MQLKRYERKYEVNENDIVQSVITKGTLAAMCDRCKRITYIDINVQYEHNEENECDETYHKITCKHCKNIYMVKTIDLLDPNIIPNHWYINEDRYFYRNSKNNRSSITLEYDLNNCVCYDLEKEMEELFKFANEVYNIIEKENMSNIICEGENDNGS